jgi:hypothetical protein
MVQRLRHSQTRIERANGVIGDGRGVNSIDVLETRAGSGDGSTQFQRKSFIGSPLRQPNTLPWTPGMVAAPIGRHEDHSIRQPSGETIHGTSERPDQSTGGSADRPRTLQVRPSPDDRSFHRLLRRRRQALIPRGPTAACSSTTRSSTSRPARKAHGMNTRAARLVHASGEDARWLRTIPVVALGSIALLPAACAAPTSSPSPSPSPRTDSSAPTASTKAIDPAQAERLQRLWVPLLKVMDRQQVQSHRGVRGRQARGRAAAPNRQA